MEDLLSGLLLSKFEKQADIVISTLRKIVSAVGGELALLARIPGETVKIDHSPWQCGSRAESNVDVI